MWKIELPYKPGESVYVPICSHTGTWRTEKCEVSHYMVKSEADITIALRQAVNHNFRFARLDEIFPTPEAATAYAEAKQKAWDEKR